MGQLKQLANEGKKRKKERLKEKSMCPPISKYELYQNFWLTLKHHTRIGQDAGEGNRNPLQCSCLENPRDGRAWWAAVYGVPQSQTRLKRLGSSSSHCQDTPINNFQDFPESISYLQLTSLVILRKESRAAALACENLPCLQNPAVFTDGCH